MKTALYLIPVPLGDTLHENVLPVYNTEIIRLIKHYIVEDVRTARRFLKKADKDIDIDTLTFYVLNKHTDMNEIESYLDPILKGESVGVISEAGCPAIADPGADVVGIAQKRRLKVIPLVGPSSILMSLMASGFNGQSFAFQGYLPIDAKERGQAIRKFESRSWTEDQTQLFIETPYRNDKLMEDLIKYCRPDTRLCIAVHISCEDEWIVTKSIAEWKKGKIEIGKKPTVFLLYKA